MTKAQAFQQKQNQIQTDLASKEQDMTLELLEKIKVIVAAVAKSAGVDLVIDADKAVYVKDGVDLTGDVIKNYSKSDSSKDDK